MATKVIILGEEPKEVKELKSIEFVSYLNKDCNFIKDSFEEIDPSNWKNIELVCKNYNRTMFDLLFAYDYVRDSGLLILGHFNDGIVK